MKNSSFVFQAVTNQPQQIIYVAVIFRLGEEIVAEKLQSKNS